MTNIFSSPEIYPRKEMTRVKDILQILRSKAATFAQLTKRALTNLY